MVETSVSWESLEREVEKFKDFIDERILWTRSHHVLWNVDFYHAKNEYLNIWRTWREHLIPLSLFVCLTFVLRFLFSKLMKLSIKPWRDRNLSPLKLLSLGFKSALITLAFYAITKTMHGYLEIGALDRGMKLFVLTNMAMLLGINFMHDKGLFLSIYPEAFSTAKVISRFFKRMVWCSPLLIVGSMNIQSVAYTFEEMLYGWFLLSDVGLAAIFGSMCFAKVIKNKKEFDARRDFEKGSLHFIVTLMLLFTPYALSMMVVCGFRESVFYIYEKWL